LWIESRSVVHHCPTVDPIDPGANAHIGALRAALLDKICDQIGWRPPAPLRSARLASPTLGALRAQHIGNTLDGEAWVADEYCEAAFLRRRCLPDLRAASVRLLASV
jgi:hypothetical protein